MEKSAREAQAKADSIDAAVYDLKAANPNDNSKAGKVVGNRFFKAFR